MFILVVCRTSSIKFTKILNLVKRNRTDLRCSRIQTLWSWFEGGVTIFSISDGSRPMRKSIPILSYRKLLIIKSSLRIMS